jgi:hypothetical protein
VDISEQLRINDDEILSGIGNAEAKSNIKMKMERSSVVGRRVGRRRRCAVCVVGERERRFPPQNGISRQI